MYSASVTHADRVPVLLYLGARFWLPLVGHGDGFQQYVDDPRTMLECQLLGQKWILENVNSDFHRIVVYPDFMWVEDADAFGAKTIYPTSDSPWIARPHLLQNDDDLERLREVDYVHSGLHGKMLRYYQEMKEIAAEYEISGTRSRNRTAWMKSSPSRGQQRPHPAQPGADFPGPGRPGAALRDPQE